MAPDTNSSASKQKTVSITRTFNLPLQTLWKAFSEAESFKKWWGPEGYTCPDCTIDFKVGGRYLANMKGPDGTDNWSTGEYQEIVPLKKIVYLDSFSDEKGNIISGTEAGLPGEWPMELNVTVTFEESNGKTILKINQTGIPEAMYDDCIKGWQQCFDKLEKNL
jgi:uncharacterized protein YndB with AHSA1/START domain